MHVCSVMLQVCMCVVSWYKCVHVCVHVCMCSQCAYVMLVCMCAYVCVQVCMCVCMCVYVCVHEANAFCVEILQKLRKKIKRGLHVKIKVVPKLYCLIVYNEKKKVTTALVVDRWTLGILTLAKRMISIFFKKVISLIYIYIAFCVIVASKQQRLSLPSICSTRRSLMRIQTYNWPSGAPFSLSSAALFRIRTQDIHNTITFNDHQFNWLIHIDREIACTTRRNNSRKLLPLYFARQFAIFASMPSQVRSNSYNLYRL